MYLHIGKEYTIDTKKIIGIFNMKTIRNSKEYKVMYKTMKNDLIDISDGVQKTLILISDKNIKGYITNISSATLKKRKV